MTTLAPTEIKVISINCWGLKYISKYRTERLREIGKYLASATLSPSIVGLQECWTQQDYLAIREETKHILPYGKFYYSGIFGGGLAILSIWPIEESSMYQYPLNGRPSAFYRGDWYVGKGVACARIRYGVHEKDILEVFTTHLHAPYEKEPHDSYMCHRTAQAWNISKLMRGAAERGHLVLAMGDFNMVPQSLAHQLICTHALVQDAWMALHPDCSLGAATHEVERARRRPIPTAVYNLTENGATCDSVLNTWRWNKGQQKRLGPGRPKQEVPLDTVDENAQRLDYIFVSTALDAVNSPRGGWLVKSTKVGLLERHPTLQCSLSDHFSVEATLVHSRVFAKDGYLSFRNEACPESPEWKDLSFQLRYNQPPFLPVHTYNKILAMIHQYTLRQRKQRRYRLGHFLGSVLVTTTASLIGVWWSPQNYVAFILILVSSLGLAAGVIDGLIGGLFVSSEIRALKEFEWEMRNTRAAAGGEPHVIEDEVVKSE